MRNFSKKMMLKRVTGLVDLFNYTCRCLDSFLTGMRVWNDGCLILAQGRMKTNDLFARERIVG